MDFWLIRNGEKSGPLPDYEIRSKIESGELGPDDPAWSEGMSNWVPLKTIALFSELFERPIEMAEAARPDVSPPPLPEQPDPPAVYRRFWARWFDLLVYGALWWLAMWSSGKDLKALLLSPWLLVLHLVPWFLIETMMIHHFGTTPGKALLGLSVVNTDGNRLTYGQSLRRSFRVMFAGIGFGLTLISPICQLISWFTVRRIGCTLWDRAGGHRVKVVPLRTLKVSALVLGLFIAVEIEGNLLTPAMVEVLAKDFPELKEFYDKTRK
jgi:uncharacterized RDD family membrane protein YckC